MSNDHTINNNSTNLIYAFVLAIVLHGLVFMAIYAMPKPQYVSHPKQEMVVVLVPRITAAAAKFNKKHRKKAQHIVENISKTQAQFGSDTKPTILRTQRESGIKASLQTSRGVVDTAQTPEPKTNVAKNEQRARMRAEIADISAEFERVFDEHAKYLRRRSISAEHANLAYAAYLKDWQNKVELIGNTNYPEEIRRLNLHGDLVLQVTLQANGDIQQVRIVHSSGYELLDAAAIRIVRLAAPFAPFPEAIRKEVDILDITRTWEFLTTNRLNWSE